MEQKPLMEGEMIDLIRKLILTESTTVAGGKYKSRADLDSAIFSILYIWAELRSKDPRTKVGAAIYEATTGSLHMGYNGFNHGVPDEKELWDNRNAEMAYNKYDYIVHAETNAIMKALRAGFDPMDSTLYCTHFPCHRCLKDSIIPSGIKVIKYLSDYPPDPKSFELLTYTDITMKKIIPNLSGI